MRPRARCAVGVAEFDAALEDVGVVVERVPGGIRRRNAEDGAKFYEEKTIIGALLPASAGAPAGDKTFDIHAASPIFGAGTLPH